MQNIELLSWDSRFFKYKVGRVTSSHLQDALRDAKKEGIKLLYLFVDPKNKELNKSAIVNGGGLVDEKVTFVANVQKAQDSNIDEGIVPYEGELTDELLSLALQSGEYSRYKIDTHFVHNEFERLYTEWIKKSLSHEIAKEVLVYKSNMREVGLLTLGEKDKRADIGLLAVDANFRGKSVGTKLIQAAMKRAKALGFDEIQVATQKKNEIACRFYTKNGFVQERIDNIYHFWFN